jgi:NitT/TauT family transport system ATP-binding protein
VFVTHDMREAIALADRIIFLSRKPTHVVADVTVPLDRSVRWDAAAVERARIEIARANSGVLVGDVA